MRRVMSNEALCSRSQRSAVPRNSSNTNSGRTRSTAPCSAKPGSIAASAWPRSSQMSMTMFVSNNSNGFDVITALLRQVEDALGNRSLDKLAMNLVAHLVAYQGGQRIRADCAGRDVVAHQSR